MLQKYDTSFPKAALDSIIKTVSTLPSDKNLSTRSVKLLLIEKRDTTTIPFDWGTAET
jgi:2-oxoglutarate dehydrogenase E1 component